MTDTKVEPRLSKAKLCLDMMAVASCSESGKHKAPEAGGCPPPAPKRLHVPDDNLQDAATGKFQQLLSTRCMVCLNEDHT